MQKKHGIVHTITNAAIFIIMEVAALNMLRSNGVIQNFLISKQIHSFMGKIWGGSESLKQYFSLKDENQKLANDNFILMQKLQKYENIQAKEKLNSLIENISMRPQFSYMPVTIVKVSKNKQHNYLILGQGEDNGVKAKSGIITVDGVLGIVNAVGKHYSYAVSIQNTELCVSARIGNEGAIGPLVWDGKTSTGAILQAIPLQYKFSPGDTVYTSGYSSIFPPDIPLGIAGESRIVNGATYDIKVKLFKDPGTVRYAIVVRNLGTPEIEELEQKKEDK
jgi:hypothetical protein